MYHKYSPISFNAPLSTRLTEKRLDLGTLEPEHHDALKLLSRSGAVPLGTLLSNKCFRGVSLKASDYKQKGVSVIKIGTITGQGGINREKLSYVAPELYSRSALACGLRPDDIIVVATGDGSIGNTALFADDEPALTTAENCVVRVDESQTDPYYVAAFLLTKYGRAQLEANALGPSGQTHLYPHQVERIVIPLLPGAKGIGESYRKAFDLRKKIDQIPALVGQVFEKYFSKSRTAKRDISNSVPIRICISERRLDPSFWSPAAAELNNALTRARGTISLLRDLVLTPIHRGRQPNYEESAAIPVLKTTDVHNRRIAWERCRKVEEGQFVDTPFAQLQRDDIVVTSTGEGSWGRAALVDRDKAWADGHLAVIRIDKRLIDPYAVLAFLWSDYGRIQLEQRVRGSTGQTEIYPQDIETLRIIMPSIPDQDFIRGEILNQFAFLDEADSIQNECIKKIESILEEY